MSNYLNDEHIVRKNVKIGELTFEGFDVQGYVDTGLPLPEEFSEGRFGFYKGV